MTSECILEELYKNPRNSFSFPYEERCWKTGSWGAFQWIYKEVTRVAKDYSVLSQNQIRRTFNEDVGRLNGKTWHIFAGKKLRTTNFYSLGGENKSQVLVFGQHFADRYNGIGCLCTTSNSHYSAC